MTMYKRNSYLAALFLLTAFSVFWLFSSDGSFCGKDALILLDVSANRCRDLFSFIPHSYLSGWPVGKIFVRTLYILFGLDWGRYHAAFVMIHFFNTGLVFLVTEKAAEILFSEERGYQAGFLAAAFLGISGGLFSSALRSVSESSNLIGTTFALLSLWFYIQWECSMEYRGQNLFLAMLFCYIALRTGPVFSLLPFFYASYEWCLMWTQGKRVMLSKAFWGGLFMAAVLEGTALLYGIKSGELGGVSYVGGKRLWTGDIPELYFLGVLGGVVLAAFLRYLKKEKRGIFILMCIMFLWSSGYTKASRNMRAFFLAQARREGIIWEDIRQIQPPQSDGNLYIIDQNGEIGSSSAEMESICRLLYKNVPFQVEILEEPDPWNYRRPYVVWNYENGRVTEVERKDDEG